MSWWDAPERLDDSDLRAAVRAAGSVLYRRGDVEDDPQEMPQSVLVSQLREALEVEGLALSREDAMELAKEPMARPVAEAVLREVGGDPELRDAIERARRAAEELMVVDPGTLGVLALLLLATKVRRVRVGRQGIDVEFDQVKTGVVSRIGALLGP